MRILSVLKIIFLLIAVIYGYSNTIRAIKGQAVTGCQIMLMAIGIVGFVTIQFNLLGI